MKNWLIVLIIFIVPMALYGVLSSDNAVSAYLTDKMAQDAPEEIEIVEVLTLAPVPQNSASSPQNLAQVSLKGQKECKLPTFYKFYSTMCGQCQKLDKEMTGLEDQFAGKINFVSVNVGGKEGEMPETKALVRKYSIRAVPAVVILNADGKTIKRYNDVVKHKDLEAFLKQVAAGEVK